MMDKENISFDTIKDYFENFDFFEVRDILESADVYPDSNVYETTELIRNLAEHDPDELVRKFVYGDGRMAYSSEFCKINDYGNIEACDLYEEAKCLIDDYLDEDVLEDMLSDFQGTYETDPKKIELFKLINLYLNNNEDDK